MMLRESEHLEEQGDILQYLVDTQGLNYDTGTNMSKSRNLGGKILLRKDFWGNFWAMQNFVMTQKLFNSCKLYSLKTPCADCTVQV